MIDSRSLSAIAASIVLPVLLAGCNSNPLTSLLRQDSYECQTVEPSASTSGGKIVTLDDRLASVGGEFGGYVYDWDNKVLSVYMRDPIDRAAAEKVQARLSQMFKSEFGDAELRVLQAQYTIRQLKKWKHLSTNILSLDGVNMQDLDESKNRLTFGILNTSPVESVRECIYKNADKLGIPQGAIQIVERAPGSRL